MLYLLGEREVLIDVGLLDRCGGLLLPHDACARGLLVLHCALCLQVERRSRLGKGGTGRRHRSVQAANRKASKSGTAKHCHGQHGFGRGGGLAARSANHLMGVDNDLPAHALSVSGIAATLHGCASEALHAGALFHYLILRHCGIRIRTGGGVEEVW